MTFTTLVRALVDDGYVTAAVPVIILTVLAGLVRRLARIGPDLVRAACQFIATRRAINATSKAERDQTFRVLQALIGAPTQAHPPAPHGKTRRTSSPPTTGRGRRRRPPDHEAPGPPTSTPKPTAAKPVRGRRGPSA